MAGTNMTGAGTMEAVHEGTDVTAQVELAEKLKALSDPSRLKILEFLLEPDSDCCSREDGVCGCDFEELLGLSQPTVSHHLKILVNAGFLSAHKRGRWTYYELVREPFTELSGYLGKFGLQSFGVEAMACGPAGC